PSIQAPAVKNVAADATSARLPGGIAEGHHHSLLRALGCNGLWSQTNSTQLNVDLTPPKPTIYGVPTKAWSRTPVALTIAGTDGLSGIASVFGVLDGGTPVTTIGNSTGLVVGEGRHDIAYGATDVAGNESAAASARVQVDSIGPDASFETPREQAPADLQATVTDTGSGIADGWIELAGATDGDSSSWQPLETSFLRVQGGSVQLSAHFPDERLADGEYKLRIVATDVAGNITRTTRLANSIESLALRVPLRAHDVLTAGLATVNSVCVTAAGKACTKRTRCASKKGRCTRKEVVERASAASSRLVDYGTRVVVTGSLRAANGAPLPNTRLDAVDKLPDSAPAFTQSAFTDDQGHYELPIKADASRTTTIRFAGDASHAPVEQTVSLTVRGGIFLTVLRHNIKGGDSIYFSGRLQSGAAFVPSDGKLVTLEFQRGRSWVPTVGTLWTDNAGHFDAVWPSSKAAAKTAYRFRATVPRSPLWPFETGYSRPTVVSIYP
ncbi:MAG: Ig-like domain repeat protein, partial [Thermoleophilaceae bacterium]|nr:Ig-like domain repeat protein [Thermoleophilaceae bacterium]